MGILRSSSEEIGSPYSNRASAKTRGAASFFSLGAGFSFSGVFFSAFGAGGFGGSVSASAFFLSEPAAGSESGVTASDFASGAGSGVGAGGTGGGGIISTGLGTAMFSDEDAR